MPHSSARLPRRVVEHRTSQPASWIFRHVVTVEERALLGQHQAATFAIGRQFDGEHAHKDRIAGSRHRSCGDDPGVGHDVQVARLVDEDLAAVGRAETARLAAADPEVEAVKRHCPSFAGVAPSASAPPGLDHAAKTRFGEAA